MKSFTTICLVLLLGACGDSTESGSLSCEQALDAYCTANPTECANRDYAGALSVACNSQPAGNTHGFADCGAYHLLSEQTGNGPVTTRYFELNSGTLVAVTVESGNSSSGSSAASLRCLAGPANFQVPSCPQISGTPCTNSTP
jgi:hypothetical protein